MMSGCQQTVSSGASIDLSATTAFANDLPASVSNPVGESAVSSNSYDAVIQNGNLDILLTFAQNIHVDHISLDGYWLAFDYAVGALQGNAKVRVSFGRLDSVAWDDNKPIDSMTLVFEYDAGHASLTANWCKDDTVGIDTFVLDEITNLWYYQWANADIFPVSSSEQEAGRLFPDEKIQDVSFYRVSDFDNIYGPDISLGYYREYTSEDAFLWQTNEMYRWHISIQYMDSAGNIHFLSYVTKKGVAISYSQSQQVVNLLSVPRLRLLPTISSAVRTLALIAKA